MNEEREEILSEICKNVLNLIQMDCFEITIQSNDFLKKMNYEDFNFFILNLKHLNKKMKKNIEYLEDLTNHF